MTFKAVPTTSPASSKADQNRGSSESDNTRSRLRVSFRRTLLHGFVVTPPTSSRMAQENIALAAASVWFATVGEVMRGNTAFTSARLMSAARSLLHAGNKFLRTR
jgi:hypothetical protein